MRIIHISDLHITDNGKPIWGVDTLRNFNLILERVRKIKDIDAIFLTGDIADDGNIWAYQYVDKKMYELGIPTYVCPGNHDWIPTLMDNMKHCRFESQVDIKGWKFVVLDSTVIDEMSPNKNRARGFLKDDDYSLINELASNTSMPITIVLHHSPIEPGEWMNKKLLEDRDRFRNFIAKYDNVKMVMFGHVHYAMKIVLDNILYLSASSTGFAFNPKLPKYEIDYGSEGFNIIDVDGTSINVIAESMKLSK